LNWVTRSTGITRKLVAEGYCSERHSDGTYLILKFPPDNEEYVCEARPEKLPKGIMVGSIVRIYDDSTEIELVERFWTTEEIEEIKKGAEKLEKLFGTL